jgi:hypothetical protein
MPTPLNTMRAIGLATALLAGTASATIVYDEAVDGEMSEDRFNPTVVTVGPGVNNVIFVTTPSEDRDIFTFTVADGFQLSGIVLAEFETEPIGNLAFLGFAAGDILPTDPFKAPDASALLGYALVGEGDVGSDLFLPMGMASGAIGYDGPLGPGAYTFWAQETGDSADLWNLGFVIEPIPAPGAIALLGLAGLARQRRRA